MFSAELANCRTANIVVEIRCSDPGKRGLTAPDEPTPAPHPINSQTGGVLGPYKHEKK
jgi:hypothetical protein